jgi:murein DD-endopeptidase MepM/ murein hydrolase activator NlpD
MKLQKKLFCIFCSIFFLICITFPVSAREAVYEGDDYALHLYYTDVVYPGDAILLQLHYIPGFSLFTSKNKFFIQASAELTLAGNQEILRKTVFFAIDKLNQKLTAFIPLSTWYTEENFSAKITYQLFEIKQKGNVPILEKMEFEVPVIMKNKDFLEETIDLNASNTAIKTDTSSVRIKQIDTLNELINQVNIDDIYQINPFKYPVTSTKRTSFFGDRRTYAYSNGTNSTSLHYGIDFGVPTGTPVFACGDGKVVLTENRVTTGWTVIIEHLPGLYSLYYHLDSYSVKVGQMVKEGQKIASSGSTGLATGPHLHWEVRMNGDAVNPDWFIDKFVILNPK